MSILVQGSSEIPKVWGGYHVVSTEGTFKMAWCHYLWNLDMASKGRVTTDCYLRFQFQSVTDTLISIFEPFTS